MKLTKLKIQGFKSFVEEQILDFSSLQIPGFFFLTGQNLVEPKLGANGVGKSSLYDAVTWVLYGKTVSGLKASSVGNWENKVDCKVEIQFELEDRVHTITRTWSPNSLQLNSIETAQDKIDELVGLNYESFLYTVLVGQFTVKFFDLSPADKLQLFTEVLDLDRWLKYSEEAKKQTGMQENLSIKQEQSISHIKGQVESLTKQDLTEKIKNWEVDRTRKIQESDVLAKNLRGRKQVLSNVLSGLEEERDKMDTVDSIISELDKVNKACSGLELDARKFMDEDKEIQIKLSSEFTTLNYMNDEWARLKNIKKSGQCPVCLQKVDELGMEGHVEELKNKIRLVEKKIGELQKMAKEHQGNAKVVEGGIYRLKNDKKYMENALKEKKDRLYELSKHIDDNKREQKWIIHEIGKIKDDMQKAKVEENPYVKLQKQNDIRISELNVKLKELDDELLIIRNKQSIYKYWEKGFREIRLMVVEEVLKEFEIQTSNNLQRLGLSDWQVIFSVDQETKAGTVRKGFTVLIQSPINNELVPFECWSGGEGQRLRLAGTLGLMDLIANRTSHRWSVELWDEPTAFLAQEGIDDLLQVLRDRAYREQKQVILADHRDFITRGDFTGVINVVKNKEGSRVSCE